MRAAFDRRVRRIGLTRSQWQVLSLLHRRPGVSQSELAEMLEVERATAGRMIDRLEQKGWVQPPPRPRRPPHQAPAPDRGGRGRAGGDGPDRRRDDRRRHGRACTPSEREALTDMMERVKTQLQTMAPRAVRAGAGQGTGTARVGTALAAEAVP